MIRNLIAVLLTTSAAPALAETLYVQAGHVIVDASQPALGASTITVTDGKIVAITPGLIRAEPSAKVIDLSTKTVLPGLIDMHVHLESDPGGDFRDDAVIADDYLALVGAKNARITAKAGFTTVRDLGVKANAKL
jgi:imidazolonepropionase-like amidohydrolase